MWHEARKQERLIRGMIVDYRRRAERRKDFYEKIKAEPMQFLQLYGRPCKIHLDPAIAAAGEGPAIMMPWQGDTNNMIDRFDVRAHLDHIPEIKVADVPPEELSPEERHCNYERYRILAQNMFLGIGEDKFLQQLAIEEQFGVAIEEKETQKEKLHERKGTGAAIGYNYSDPGAQPSSTTGPEVKTVEQKDSDEDSDLDVIDVDLSIDVNKMEASQAHELNAVGPRFGMAGCDLFSFLTGDADDAEHQKQLLREEKEKAMFSGRKSRRERRAHRDKKFATRVLSPPSYAAPSSQPARSPSRSATRSPSPDTGEKIEFITSFGGEEEEGKLPVPTKASYSDKVKQNLKMSYSDVARKPRGRSSLATEKRSRPHIGPHGPKSLSRSRSFSRSRSRSRSRYRSRSRSRSRSWRKSRSSSLRSAYSRSRSRSTSPYRRSRSKPRSYKIRRSRSPANHTSGYAKRNKSRSMSIESNDRSVQSKPSVPRYYGRRKEDKSSSELSIDSDSSGSANDAKNKTDVDNRSNTYQNQIRLSGSSSKGPSRETLSLKEKLKRKMQTQLSRQLRADKRAEAERQERETRRQARREEEIRELAIKLRRKQREMRHQQNRKSSGDESDATHSRSSSRDSLPNETKIENRSASRSVSPPPQERRIPVWNTNRESTATPYRPRPEGGENSHYSDPRKRYQEYVDPKEDKRMDDERQQGYVNRYDKYYNRDQNIRGDNYQSVDSRWREENYAPGRRRPYGHRGGYRGHGFRHATEYTHSDSSSHYPREEPDDYDRDTSGRNKVKLVDY